jgi:hypothetical protein
VSPSGQEHPVPENAVGSAFCGGHDDYQDQRITPDDLLHGETVLLKRGKKNWHVLQWR